MKRRLSASIDDHMLEAAEAAVRDGRAPSMSALIQEGLQRQLDHLKRMEASDEFIAAFEDEFGAFEPGEMERLAAEFWAGVKTADEIIAERDSGRSENVPAAEGPTPEGKRAHARRAA